MIVSNLADEFLKAEPVIKSIEEAGFEAYFVGGSVRDTILGLPIHDVDIATSAYPEEIKEIFNKTVDTGIQHGTVMVLDHGEGYEITTFRTESTYQDFRRPDHVEFVRSLEEDLKRRDFTINALAMTHEGRIIDLFDGLQDLENHIIRAVGEADERFNEDALRMMRAIRFASQLDFSIEEKTTIALKKHASLLKKIAIERIHIEFVKLLLGKNPKTGLQHFMTADLARYCPEFDNYMSELTNMAYLDSIKLSSEAAAWSLVIHVLKVSESDISHFLVAWKSSNELISNVQVAIRALNSILDKTIDRELMYETGLELLLTANEIATIFNRNIPIEILESDYEQLPIKSKKEMLVNGGQLIKEVGIQPGEKLGRILATLEHQVLMEKIPNESTQLLKLAERLASELD
ncbi:CCA tRNA nucleotidyltransferase [Dellaglioa algida]|uniref:CCA-adding enzyme n=1 Tax=Dellaglioa algida DSM 15638 TaxID=1423719 RepID=A0A0R1HSB9_9LACO|nr:CCA tRNA nucleotidyltransferase [Dellaglioa algida]KRK46612.1 trna nucleotidyltransferase [Dellaglioa algida DSM 15638]MDK1732470.1 CCA tRNA nucleotidyltransferase [Dellaglioa algida]MDK1734141.1 CCA tRNA nucleotidyltransferase [Dellaglioa algida]